MRWLLIKGARIPSASIQLAVDRAIHLMLSWTMPPLFGGVDPRATLARCRVSMQPAPQAWDWNKDGWQPLPKSGAVGAVVPHARLLHRSSCADQPLIIWHHGAGEFPVDATIINAYQCGELDNSLVVVRAAGHHHFRSYQHQMRTAPGAAAMLAASVTAIESIRQAWTGPVIIAGLSLGGMVAALHADWHGEQETQRTRWAPIAAGPDLASVVLRSGFARLTDDRTRKMSGVRAILHDGIAEHLSPSVATRIHPLLGQWDVVHTLRDQGLAWRRCGVYPRVVRRGHIGLAIDGYAIGRHLAAVAERFEGGG